MDPNANLDEQRQLVAAINEIVALTDEYNPLSLEQDFFIAKHAIRLVELVQALDEWLTRGGFPPSPWQHSRKVS